MHLRESIYGQWTAYQRPEHLALPSHASGSLHEAKDRTHASERDALANRWIMQNQLSNMVQSPESVLKELAMRPQQTYTSRHIRPTLSPLDYRSYSLANLAHLMAHIYYTARVKPTRSTVTVWSGCCHRHIFHELDVEMHPTERTIETLACRVETKTLSPLRSIPCTFPM